jgi:Uncharacterized conserved protein (DUF2183)
MNRRLVSALAVAIAVGAGALATSAIQGDAEEIVFYPTYGVKQASDWRIDVRAKVQEPRDVGAAIATLLGRVPAHDARELAILKARLADFIADDQSGEEIRLVFDADSTQTPYRIAADDGTFPSSNADGVVDGTLTLPDTVAQRLLTEQRSSDGWLTYHAVSRDHTGIGRVRLIGPTGVSVISDIDDTIKVTKIPAGARVVAQNTFYRDFVSTTELAGIYRDLAGAPVHYVSGGPWQLYRPLAMFLIDGHHPEGSFHMKPLAGGIRSPVTSLENLARFAMPAGTFEHKTSEISRIMKRFPGRTFVLIGDSGEQDPEIYRNMQSRFGAQVERIVIRDLTNARRLCPGRLTGMTIVESPTIADCVSSVPR